MDEVTPEQWRPIAQWPGYEVSDRGRVRSHKMSTVRLRALATDRKGYKKVTLCSPAMTKALHVGSLVLEAFVGPRPPGQETRHLDGDPANNTLANLAYSTHSVNTRDKRLHGTDPNVNKTHCPAGHEYDLANTYVSPNGWRRCRACARLYDQMRSRVSSRRGFRNANS